MFQHFILLEMTWIFNEFPSFNLAKTSYQKSGETILDRRTQDIIISKEFTWKLLSHLPLFCNLWKYYHTKLILLLLKNSNWNNMNRPLVNLASKKVRHVYID